MVFSWINNGNWTEWSAIWSEIIRVISKSNERAARVRFEIASMISDQNCTPLSSITTLLNPFWNRPNTGLGQFKYFIDAEPETLLLQYVIEQRATFNQVARALFLVTRKFYCIASAHESATTARKCYYIHFEIAQIQDLVDSNILLMQYWAGFKIKSRIGNAFTSKYAIEQCTTLN